MVVPARRDVRLLGLSVLLIGIWGGIVPFVGPTFGFYMGSHLPAWTWNQSHAELHVAPAVAAVVGGLLMLSSVRRPMQSAGTLLAMIGGVWFVIGPSLYSVWAGAGSSMAGMGMHSAMMHSTMTMTGAGQSTGMTALEAIGYHYGTGAAIAVLASVGFGLLLAAGRVGAPAAAVERSTQRRTPISPFRTTGRRHPEAAGHPTPQP